MKKKDGAIKGNQGLGHFIRDWDFGRFVHLVEKLNISDPFPKKQEIEKALKDCRVDRNLNSHSDGDPEKQGRNDAELAGLVQSARTYLPLINDLKDAEPNEIYNYLKRLDDCLFCQE